MTMLPYSHEITRILGQTNWHFLGTRAYFHNQRQENKTRSTSICYNYHFKAILNLQNINHLLLLLPIQAWLYGNELNVKDIKDAIYGIFKHCSEDKMCHEYQKGINNPCSKLAHVSSKIREILKSYLCQQEHVAKNSIR